jgi:hypothetical protein
MQPKTPAAGPFLRTGELEFGIQTSKKGSAILKPDLVSKSFPIGSFSIRKKML